MASCGDISDAYNSRTNNARGMILGLFDRELAGLLGPKIISKVIMWVVEKMEAEKLTLKKPRNQKNEDENTVDQTSKSSISECCPHKILSILLPFSQ